MPVPSNEWEHLQSVLMTTYNRDVREEFSDVDDDDEYSTPRSSLKQACLIRNTDSAIQCNIRMNLFYFTLRKASDLQAPLYGIPTDAYQQTVKFRPQVKLFFIEDLEDVETGYRPIEAEVTYRLINDTSETVSIAQSQALALKIKTEFCAANGYRWRKGRLKASYKDESKGYSMVISAYSETEAREVITKVLSLENHTLENENLTISELQQSPPIVPPTKLIYGKSRRLPRKRPVGYVRFRWAELHLWGMPKAITLVDRLNLKHDPVIRN